MIKVKTKTNVDVTLEGYYSCMNKGIRAIFIHPVGGLCTGRLIAYNKEKGAYFVGLSGSKKEVTLYLSISEDDYNLALAGAEEGKEKYKLRILEDEKQFWIWSESCCPTDHVPAICIHGSSDYLNEWRLQDGTIFPSGIYSLSSPQGVSYHFFPKQFVAQALDRKLLLEIDKQNQEIKLLENKKKQLIEERKHFENCYKKAKEIGSKVEIKRFTVDCTDSREECNLDICVIYVTPDGQVEKVYFHSC